MGESLCNYGITYLLLLLVGVVFLYKRVLMCDSRLVNKISACCIVYSDICGDIYQVIIDIVKLPDLDLLETVNWAKNPGFCWSGI